MAGAEVGAVAAEDLDPLLACVVDGVGDQVGDVAVAAAGHADVRRCRAGRLADDEVRGVNGLPLGAVRGRGEGELDVSVDVVGGQLALAGAAGDDEAAVVADAGNRPDVAVGDAEVAVVAARCDAVTEPDALTTAGDGLTIPLTSRSRRRSRMAALMDPTCSRVSAMISSSPAAPMSASACGALDLAGVDDDLAARSKSVEDLTGTLTSAHEQAEVGVRRVG